MLSFVFCVGSDLFLEYERIMAFNELFFNNSFTFCTSQFLEDLFLDFLRDLGHFFRYLESVLHLPQQQCFVLTILRRFWGQTSNFIWFLTHFVCKQQRNVTSSFKQQTKFCLLCGVRSIFSVYMQSYNPGVLGWGFLRLLLRLQLRTLSRGVPSLNLEKGERVILGHMYLFMNWIQAPVFKLCWKALN